MEFTHVQAPSMFQNYYGAGPLYSVDGASPDCAEWFIKTVYQPQYDRFGKDFGKTIVGYFYDEPETHGDWGSEVLPMLAERGVDWRRALVAWKFALAGEEQTAARFAYLDTFVEWWGRTMYGGMARWCKAHMNKPIVGFIAGVTPPAGKRMGHAGALSNTTVL